jgi:hypothetical protein
MRGTGHRCDLQCAAGQLPAFERYHVRSLDLRKVRERLASAVVSSRLLASKNNPTIPPTSLDDSIH